MVYIFLLILLEVFLFVTNYRPGAYLIGWDNVMPEFNLLLNFKRSLFGVWQDYRGLGIPDGMSHAANLFHTIYIFLLDLFLPQNLLRYSFIFSTHLIGGIGFFVLSSYLFNQSEKKVKILCFIGALFYMLNLGTVQVYFTPLEVFAVHFAALPWLTLFIIKALRETSKKNLLFLFIASLLFSSQGFVPTVFFAFLILPLSFVFFHILQTKNFKVGLAVLLTVLLANAFWLLPYSFNAIANQSVIRNTRINEFSSEEIFYRNRAHGDLKSAISMKGFMLNTIEFDTTLGKDVLLMFRWWEHYNSPLYQILFSLVALTALIGISRVVLKKDKALYPYALSMLIAFVFLANNTIILEQVNSILRGLVPVLGEALRFPFTKFVILFAFCFSIFLTYGLIFISSKIKRAEIVLGLVSFFIILYLSYPAFKGQFISPLLRLSLPNYYKEAFSYFSDKDNGRIAIFPMYTFWNWQYRSWGARGSGFLWYGIPNPITERAFDPWSNFNEKFYNEMSHAVNSANPDLFKDLILKYNLRYILVDTTVLNSITRYGINYDSLLKFLDDNNFASSKKTFGKLILYELSQNSTPVFAINNPPEVYPVPKFQKEDLIYSTFGNYLAAEKSAKMSFLFPSLYMEKLQEDNEFEAVEDKETITLISKKKYPKLAANSVLSIPSFYDSGFLIPVEVKAEGNKITIFTLYPKLYINGERIEAKDKPLEISTSLNVSYITFSDINYSVPFKRGTVKSFLLKDFPNNIRVGDGTRGENILIDTRSTDKQPFLIPFGKNEISEVKIVVDKVKGSFGSDNIISQDYDLKRNIGGFELYKNPVSIVKKEKERAFLEAQGNSSSELSFYKDNLFHQAEYILFAESKHKSGLPVNFYMDNPFQKRPEIETKLSKEKEENVIVIPKTEEVFKGYGFHFVVKSVGSEKASASIEKISLYPFPERLIRDIKILTDTNPIEKNTNIIEVESEKLAPSVYIAEAPKQDSYLVLSQAYDRGWAAYSMANGNPFDKLRTSRQNSKVKSLMAAVFPFVFGEEIKNHVLVNNWANGWDLNGKWQMANGKSIVIVYLPQYLQYLGFILTAGTIIIILLKNLKRSRQINLP